MKNNNYIHHVPYLRNNIAIWSWLLVHLCKIMIFPGIFFIFLKFWFFGLLESQRAKTGPWWQTNSVCYTSYLRNHISHDCHLWYTCVKFFQTIFFSGLLGGGGVKGQKMVQNEKKNYVCCASYLRNHTPHDFHLWDSCVKW